MGVVYCYIDLKHFYSLTGKKFQKHFSSLSDRSKRRRVQNLKNEHSADELAYAAQMQLRSEGKTVEASLVKKAIFMTNDITPTCSKKINNNIITPYTPREALAYMLDTDMSKASYHLTRMQAKSRGADLYPPHDKVREAKRECYPSTDSIIITDTKCEIRLQALLDHTINRIIEMQKDVLLSLPQIFEVN